MSRTGIDAAADANTTQLLPGTPGLRPAFINLSLTTVDAHATSMLSSTPGLRPAALTPALGRSLRPPFYRRVALPWTRPKAPRR